MDYSTLDPSLTFKRIPAPYSMCYVKADPALYESLQDQHWALTTRVHKVVAGFEKSNEIVKYVNLASDLEAFGARLKKTKCSTIPTDNLKAFGQMKQWISTAKNQLAQFPLRQRHKRNHEELMKLWHAQNNLENSLTIAQLQGKHPLTVVDAKEELESLQKHLDKLEKPCGEFEHQRRRHKALLQRSQLCKILVDRFSEKSRNPQRHRCHKLSDSKLSLVSYAWPKPPQL